MSQRLLNLFRRRQLDEEIDAELLTHIELAVEDAMQRGIPEAEARRAARLRFGNPVTLRERTAGADAALVLEDIRRNARYALRRMYKSPGFAATVILTLGLGIGANLAVFQLLHSLVFAQLPVAHPDELVALHAVKSPFDEQWFVSYPAYERLKQATGTSVPVIARSGFGMGLLEVHGQPAAQPARFQLASDNFFSVLGTEPAAGRLFTESDGRRDQNEWPVVVRYGFAIRQFGTVQIVGQHAVFNGLPVMIVGVTSPQFLGVMTGYAPDLWLPLEAQSSGQVGAWFDSLGPGHGIRLGDSWLDQPGIFWLWVTARVRPDGRAGSAAQWTAALQPDIALRAGAAPTPRAKAEILHAQVRLVSAMNGEGSLREDSFLTLVLLMALSASAFLAGCLNLANLSAARLSASQRDLGVRLSMGASRWRLLGLVLTEGALLAIAGSVLAGFIGRAARVVLVRWASSRNWMLDLDLHSGVPVMLFGGGLMIVALCVFSVLPAWQALGANFTGTSGSKWVKAATPQSTSARRWSSAMLSLQVSVSLLLVAMAACFAKTLIHLTRMDTGIDREHVLSVHVDMVHGYVSHHTNLPALYRTLVERLQAVPQVRSAAVEMCRLPDCGWNTAMHVFGRRDPEIADAHGEEDHVGPGYFRAMGIPLLRGRDFPDTDRTDTQKVAILNEAYAKKLFGNENPVGHWIGYQEAPHNHEFLVVAEAANARVDGPQWPAPPIAYLSINQNPAPIHSIEVRTTGQATTMAAQIRQALRDFDPQLPVTEIVPLATELDDGLGRQKLLARLTGALAGLTLVLAALGFYGVMSYRVVRRRTEIGIRMAMGATRMQVQRLILRQALMICLAGLLPGMVMTEIATRAAQSFLYGTAESKLMVLVLAILIMVGVGLLATLAPARRAASADPMEALRAE